MRVDTFACGHSLRYLSPEASPEPALRIYFERNNSQGALEILRALPKTMQSEMKAFLKNYLWEILEDKNAKALSHFIDIFQHPDVKALPFKPLEAFDEFVENMGMKMSMTVHSNMIHKVFSKVPDIDNCALAKVLIQKLDPVLFKTLSEQPGRHGRGGLELLCENRYPKEVLTLLDPRRIARHLKRELGVDIPEEPLVRDRPSACYQHLLRYSDGERMGIFFRMLSHDELESMLHPFMGSFVNFRSVFVRAFEEKCCFDEFDAMWLR